MAAIWHSYTAISYGLAWQKLPKVPNSPRRNLYRGMGLLTVRQDMHRNGNGNGRPTHQANGHDSRRPDLIKPNIPTIPLALVYERVNRQGKRVGTAKFLIVPTDER